MPVYYSYIVGDFSSKNPVFAKVGYSAYEYEYTYHLVCLNNSYYQEPMQIYSAWVLFVIAPYWEERGERK